MRRAYCAFNSGEIDTAIDLMHPEVNWPNAWEGDRVLGRSAVRAYWTRQFGAISSKVEPEAFVEEPDGTIIVSVHQVVREAETDRLLFDACVRHRYHLKDGLVVRMDVVDD